MNCVSFSGKMNSMAYTLKVKSYLTGKAFFDFHWLASAIR